MAELAFLAAIRESYDTVADAYLDRIPPPADMDPLGRAMLAAFAEIVRTAGSGRVADLGCGPGRVTAHLIELGVDAFGVDLSPTMIQHARQAYPDLRFEVGSMTALDLGDATLGGILALFSTFHTPPQHLPTVFAEFCRTLTPGGQLLLWTYVGNDEHVLPSQAYGGREVSYEVYLLPADRIADLLNQAGLVISARLAQEPADGARPHVCYLAHKPERP